MSVKYTGTSETDTEYVSLSIEVVDSDILISVSDEIDEVRNVSLCLDEYTSIQFAKDLRRSIAKIKEVKRG